MADHQVYSAIVSAVRSGRLVEPFSCAGFRRTCPGFGEGTYSYDTFLSPFTWRYGSQESDGGNGWERISG